METIETIFTGVTEYDSKSILNKLDRPISQSILDQIEAGVTLEQLDAISKTGVPILKYKTQITIHGLFPELNNCYISGYKNLFQNKNKSIGVKYNAIDEEKRQRIAKRLKTLGFYYRRNSQGTEFNIMERVTPDNFEETKRRLLELRSKIDSTLYCGHCSLWVGKSFGVVYLMFDLYINAIYESNIEPFLNKMGATVELLQAREAEEAKRDEELRLKYEEERKASEAAKAASRNSKADQISILEKYPRVEKTTEPGMYILKSFDYDNNLIFKVVYIYMLKGKQKPRFNRTEYITIHEALNHECKEGWNDSIYNGRVTGHRIK
jgi:tetrahydromethanopterin S-methyltransferase subunit G